MKCPYCGYLESKVMNSRPTEEYSAIRRRRECLVCARRFTSYEKIDSISIIVKKKDGSCEPFSRDKLITSLLRACGKRSTSLETIEEIVDNIESKIYNSYDREVLTSQIGDIALSVLREVDEVAYVRFASVYRSFKNIDSFKDELNKMSAPELKSDGTE